MRAVPAFALLVLIACAPRPERSHESVAASTVGTIASVDTATDTAAVFTRAIADHIQALRKRDGSFPDTVLIGRHMEFPRISLPAEIEGTQVLLVDPEEADRYKHRAHFTYLNVFGWIQNGTAEFRIFHFTQNMHHRTDGGDDHQLYYSVKGNAAAFMLDSIRP